MEGYNTDKSEEVSFSDVVEQPVMWGYHRDLHEADKYKAIVDYDTGKLFSIVSRDYRLIRHEEAIDQIESTLQENPVLGNYITLTEFYNDRGRMRRKYIFPEIEVEIRKGDIVNPELQLLNSYDTSWPFILILGAYRLMCTNGLVIGEKYLHFQKRHIFNFDEIDIKGQISTALDRFELQVKQWRKWTANRLTVDIYNSVMESMKFGKDALEKVEAQVRDEAEVDDDGVPIMSLWVFYNV